MKAEKAHLDFRISNFKMQNSKFTIFSDLLFQNMPLVLKRTM